jgi:hypothetical protein
VTDKKKKKGPGLMYEEVPFQDLGTIMSHIPPSIALSLYGPPGIGKTALINSHPQLQPVEQIGLAIRQVEDIGGLPMPDKEAGVTDIFPLRWFVKFCVTKDNPHPKGTIFFDEFDKGTPEKQVAVMRILSERSLEGYKIGPDVRIIVASNREQDQAGVWNEMPNVIKNRLLHIGVFPGYKQWENDFATPAGVHSLIMTWLKENPTKLVQFDPSTPAYGFPTPRSWVMASDVLHGIDNGLPNDLGFKMLVGAVGVGVANEFWAFKEYVDNCPPLAELAAGTKDFPPQDQPALWVALVARCVSAAEADLKQQNKDIRTLQMVCTILSKMPSHARNYQVLLGTWLRQRPLTKELFVDEQAMGTSDHLKVLGPALRELKRPAGGSTWGS